MRGGVSAAGNRGRLVRVVAIGAAIAAAAAGCSGQDAPMGQNALELAMSPAEGAGGAYRPDRPITVQARNGTVENVTVTTKGEAVEGALSADRSQWKSRWSLTPGAEYTVTATGLGKDGKTRTATNRFTTAKVARTVATTLEAPFDKETVGVGIPIILQFDRPVTARAAVEQALEVRSEKPVEGAWHWFGDQQVVFRTKQHWPARTDVEFRAHLAGVRMTKNHWGGKNQTVRFRVGDAHVSKADEDNHTMVVKKNGKTVRTIPVSMGRGDVRKYTTTNGNHLTMEKASPVIMDSSTVGCGPGCAGYYRQTVYSAVRISDSGEYVHSAPWSVGSQGNSNVSHGCLNMSPSNASWFYKFSHRGDPVKITGTSRELEPENGWGYWQLSWKDWVGGSALKRSQHIGPTGDIAAPAS